MDKWQAIMWIGVALAAAIVFSVLAVTQSQERIEKARHCPCDAGVIEQSGE